MHGIPIDVASALHLIWPGFIACRSPYGESIVIQVATEMFSVDENMVLSYK